MVQDEGSSSSSATSSSPLQSFSQMNLSPSSAAAAAASSSAAGGAGAAAAAEAAAPWLRELRSEERGLYLIHLLLNCAHEVGAGALDRASALLDHASALAHPSGDPMQRLASSFSDALARRALLRSFPGLLRSLPLPSSSSSSSPSSSPSSSSTSSSSSPSSSPLRHFFRLCPFLPLASALSNHAVAAAMESERVVHVVDLLAPSDPAPAADLLRLLASRPGGPPHLRLTALHPDPDTLSLLSSALSKEAELLDLPFQFHPLLCPRLHHLDLDSLKIKSGEALAITSSLALHSLLDITPFLHSLNRLNPKITVVTEQESNHNGPALLDRFVESLNFYAALFDCLESAAPRHSPERAAVERKLLGDEIRNIIVCEGADRRERHEKFDRWARRMDAAGFSRVAMGYYALLHARRLLLEFRCDGYKLREDDGCFYICWQDRALFSVSAWTCRRFH